MLERLQLPFDLNQMLRPKDLNLYTTNPLPPETHPISIPKLITILLEFVSLLECFELYLTNFTNTLIQVSKERITLFPNFITLLILKNGSLF